MPPTGPTRARRNSPVAARDRPRSAEVRIEGLRVERAVPASWKTRQLPEDDPAVDVVQVHPDEVGIDAKPLCDVDHFTQARRSTRFRTCPGQPAGEWKVFPVGG